ncbi:MAG: AMP-binding protein [Thermodesulfobacteriota bacterium]|nr:AMP-binding protein [Thermodesulfobacteriota bacterium]
MNLAQVLSQSFGKHSDRVAIVFGGRSYRFREMEEEIRKYGLWLQRRAGIGKGDRVALLLPKGMEFIFMHLAALSVGAISLPLNPGYSGEEIAYYLSDSGSSLLVTEASGLEKLGKIHEGIEGLRTLLVDEGSPDGWDSLPRELEQMEAGPPPSYPAKGDDVAMILYTSGTTGKSKGAMITHGNLVANMLALKNLWQWTERDILLHVLPLFHIHGLVIALHGGLHAGSTLIMHDKFDPQRTWKAIERDKCTLLMGVPTMYHRLVKERERLKTDLTSMRLFIAGSAPLSESLFHSFEASTGFRILDRYGMTETSLIASNPLDPHRRKPNSVGYPLPGVQVRIVSERGEDVKTGEVGEVWIQGESVFKGYWQMPGKTKESFEGRWFKSGDLGYQDPEDSLRLHLVGRAKELIITGGYNVYPKEVENVLEKHEAIQEAAVIGLPDENFGERVAAVVVFKKDQTPPSFRAIIDFCRKNLAGYKCPKEVVAVDQLPRNAMGKIQKMVFQRGIQPRINHV